MKRCAIMVSAGTYRAPGQCSKIHGLRTVKLIDRSILVCKHPRSAMEAGKVIPVKSR